MTTMMEITQPSSITIVAGSPDAVALSLADLSATAISHALMPGQSILLEVKIGYLLVGTLQPTMSYPRTYSGTSTVQTWTDPSFTGSAATATTSAFFIAYARVVG